jgi:hypothetical protein
MGRNRNIQDKHLKKDEAAPTMPISEPIKWWRSPDWLMVVFTGVLAMFAVLSFAAPKQSFPSSRRASSTNLFVERCGDAHRLLLPLPEPHSLISAYLRAVAHLSG